VYGYRQREDESPRIPLPENRAGFRCSDESPGGDPLVQRIAVQRSGASPLLHVSDVADLLGCSVRSVHERTRLGEIPHRKLPGARRCLFLEADLLAWIDGAALEMLELPDGGRIVRPMQAAA
jgi:predicted DNA-binding transcriptional regulator AlpA